MYYDVIIIGKGIIALSMAYQFAIKDNKLKIAIVGPSNNLNSATIAAGAMISCFGEINSDTFDTIAGQIKFEMCYHALNSWDEWLEGVNHIASTKVKVNHGTYIIHNSKSGIVDHKNFQKTVEKLKEYNEPFEYANPLDINHFNPVDDARALEAIWLPKEGYINPNAVLEALEKAIRKFDNVEIIDGIVNKISKNSDFSVTYNNNFNIAGKQVMVAAGAYTDKLLADLNINLPTIPIFAGVGHSLLVEKIIDLKHVIRSPNRSGACGLHLMPYDDKTLYLGASNNVFLNPESEPHSGIIHFLIECMIEQLHQDFYKARLKKILVGNRPASLDGFPLIGQTSMDGLWIVSGTYRDGFHQSPVIANEVVKKMMGEETMFDLELFHPQRKPIQSYTLEESIQEAANHYIAGAYERSMKLPKAGWDNFVKTMIQEKIGKLYDTIGIDYSLNPDILLMFQFEENQEELINILRRLS